MLKKFLRYTLIVLRGTILLFVIFSISESLEKEKLQELNYSQRLFFYTLGPGDVIKIEVYQHPEFDAELTVDPDGTITLPMVAETLKVSGLLKEELSTEISRILDRYIKNPRVNVKIVAYNSKFYYVFGEVKNPGRFLMSKPNITLLDALVESGMPRKTAALGSVHVISPDTKTPTYKIINVSRILYKGELKYNVVLKPGDIVYVPNSFINETNFILNQILGPLLASRAIKENIEDW